MSVTKTPPAVRRVLLDNAQHRNRSALYQCAGCRKYFPAPALQVDHIVPEVDSTPEQRTDPANLQLLCAPKGSNRWTSCHKKKTAKEHAARAKLNRVPFRWGPAAVYGSCASVVAGYTWFDVMVQDSDAAMSWALWSSAAWAVAFSTYLVQKGFRRRRPRKANSPEQVSDDGPRLDRDRILEAVREVMGGNGTICVDETDYNTFSIRYLKTGWPDHVDDKRFDLLAKIQAKIGGRWLPTWDTENDSVVFNRRPELARMIRHPGFAEGRPWSVIPIAPGVDIDLMKTPHVLIIGTTGAGKTALMRTVIAGVINSAAKDDSTRLILADPKQIEMPGFTDWPGVQQVISETEDLWDMAFDIEKEMNDRLRLIKAKKAKPSDFRKVVVVIDEYEQFFKRMDRHWKNAFDDDGKPLKKGGARVPPAIDAMQSVLSMARRVNIHIIIGTQSPDASWFGGTGTRENLAGRIAVGPVDSVRARMMFDDSSVGRDVPIEFKGRATVQVGDGAPQEIQVYYTPDPFDPDEENTEEDWASLLNLGMPTTCLPEKFKGLVAA